MQNMIRGFHDDVHHLSYYRDLRDEQDDRRILRNPHKGWYWHYIDNGFGSPEYRTNTPPEDDLHDFPGLNHLYLRFDWGDIEHEEGVLDWPYIDQIMALYAPRDYRFSIRICTYEAADEGPCANATPQWVYDAGAKYTLISGMREPEYGDPIFLDKLGRFLMKCGEKFNKNPLIETIDVGSYGTWGEGHTCAGSEKTHSLDVMKIHLDLHAMAFPDMHVLMNDDIINHRSAHYPNEESVALLEYAKSLGFGLRDDSVCVPYFAEHFGYNTLRTPYMFHHFWRNAPVDLELQHYKRAFEKGDTMNAGLPFIEAMRDTHATYAGFHGDPRPWLEHYPELTAYCANRLGYWYFLEGVQLPPMRAGLKYFLTLAVGNRGFAPCYTCFDAFVRLVDIDGSRSFERRVSLDNRRWQPGEIALDRFALDLRGISAAEYELQFGLFDNSRPIELGMNEGTKRDGWYALGKVNIAE